jgi:hypothetical protein
MFAVQRLLSYSPLTITDLATLAGGAVSVLGRSLSTQATPSFASLNSRAVVLLEGKGAADFLQVDLDNRTCRVHFKRSCAESHVSPATGSRDERCSTAEAGRYVLGQLGFKLQPWQCSNGYLYLRGSFLYASRPASSRPP